MAFPISPVEGQIYKNKVWRSSSSTWIDGSAIAETGSNSNGSYIKYSDGTMEEWGIVITSSDGLMLDTSGTFPNNTGVGTVDFPITFNSTSITVTATIQRVSDGSFGAFISIHNITTTEFKWRQTAGNSQASVAIHWHARGRWK